MILAHEFHPNLYMINGYFFKISKKLKFVTHLPRKKCTIKRNNCRIFEKCPIHGLFDKKMITYALFHLDCFWKHAIPFFSTKMVTSKK